MYIGIDLGGTNIAIGLVDDNGKILKKGSRPTIATRPYTDIVKDMAELSGEVVAAAGFTMKDVDGIGIGCPGTIDNENGVVIYANNLNWNNAKIREELQKYYDLPVNIENDANAAAYGEYAINGNNAESFIAITLGTGVGGGIVIDNKIYRGFNGAGAELGHITLVHNGEACSCGRKGCWESYASVTALIRQTDTAILNNPTSLMAKNAEKDGEVNGRTSFDAAKAGDTVALEVVKKYIEYVADGISSIINIFQPNVLVIGGGISKEGDYLLEPVKKYVEKVTYCKEVPQTEIKIATLRNDAGIIGAALATNAK